MSKICGLLRKHELYGPHYEKGVAHAVGQGGGCDLSLNSLLKNLHFLTKKMTNTNLLDSLVRH